MKKHLIIQQNNDLVICATNLSGKKTTLEQTTFSSYQRDTRLDSTGWFDGEP